MTMRVLAVRAGGKCVFRGSCLHHMRVRIADEDRVLILLLRLAAAATRDHPLVSARCI